LLGFEPSIFFNNNTIYMLLAAKSAKYSNKFGNIPYFVEIVLKLRLEIRKYSGFIVN